MVVLLIKPVFFILSKNNWKPMQIRNAGTWLEEESGSLALISIKISSRLSKSWYSSGQMLWHTSYGNWFSLKPMKWILWMRFGNFSSRISGSMKGNIQNMVSTIDKCSKDKYNSFTSKDGSQGLTTNPSWRRKIFSIEAVLSNISASYQVPLSWRRIQGRHKMLWPFDNIT